MTARARTSDFRKGLLFAGSGGQGMMLAGKLFAMAGMEAGFDVTYMPSYGAEVRGGTAHCHVKLARGDIASPVVEVADLLVVMNEPSYEKFSPVLGRGSILVSNRSLIPELTRHPGVEVHALELTRIASEMGSLRSANMLVLGLSAGLLGCVKPAGLRRLVEDELGQKSPALLDANLRILERGFDLASGRGD